MNLPQTESALKLSQYQGNPSETLMACECTYSKASWIIQMLNLGTNSLTPVNAGWIKPYLVCQENA